MYKASDIIFLVIKLLIFSLRFYSLVFEDLQIVLSEVSECSFKKN